jgi:hypothetical protein
MTYVHPSSPDQASCWLLYYGGARSPLARVVPDAKYPGIVWRIRWPDGQPSAMANLTRAKDAAMALAVRGPPARNPSRFRWRQDRSDSPSAPPGRARASLPATGEARTDASSGARA